MMIPTRRWQHARLLLLQPANRVSLSLDKRQKFNDALRVDGVLLFELLACHQFLAATTDAASPANVEASRT